MARNREKYLGSEVGAACRRWLINRGLDQPLSHWPKKRTMHEAKEKESPIWKGRVNTTSGNPPAQIVHAGTSGLGLRRRGFLSSCGRPVRYAHNEEYKIRRVPRRPSPPSMRRMRLSTGGSKWFHSCLRTR